jgi:hypothetical protein
MAEQRYPSVVDPLSDFYAEVQTWYEPGIRSAYQRDVGYGEAEERVTAEPSVTIAS